MHKKIFLSCYAILVLSGPHIFMKYGHPDLPSVIFIIILVVNASIFAGHYYGKVQEPLAKLMSRLQLGELTLYAIYVCFFPMITLFMGKPLSPEDHFAFWYKGIWVLTIIPTPTVWYMFMRKLI